MPDAGTLTLDRVLAPPPVPTSLTGVPPASPSGSSRRVLGAAAAIVIAGTVIRFAALSTSIWFDESVTVKDVDGSFGQMLHRVVNHEASPPFYFVCLWTWRHLVGSSGADMRALSALTGSLTIALAFYVAQRRLGQRAGLILAICVAFSPSLFYYSTEMRMYGVLVLLTGIGFEAFLCASEKPTARNLSIWAVVSALALWTQYYAALAVAPEALWLAGQAWKYRPRRRGTFLAVGAVALTVIPLTYLMIYQAHRAFPYGARLLSSPWQQAQLSLHTFPTLGGIFEALVVGPAGPARALVTLVTALVFAVAFGVLRSRRLVSRRQAIRAGVLIVPAFLIVEAVIYAEIALSGRYVLPLWLPVGLGAAYALASIGRLGLGLTAVLLCAWIATIAISCLVPKFAPRDDTLGAARSLGVATTDRLIAINQPWDALAFEEYRPMTSAEAHAVVRVRELDVIAMPQPPPSEHQRPSSIGAGVPNGLHLAQVVKGSTFLVERFVAATPVSIRIDGRGLAFNASGWRFFNEPAGGRMGGL
jgi:hypothetical protein